MALLYAIEATDFHFETPIAAAEHPMLIDLESLFHPRFAEQTNTRCLFVCLPPFRVKSSFKV